MNGKKAVSIDEPLIKFHRHKECEITDDELERIKSMERMKEIAKTQNISVPMIHEGETLALKSSGKSVNEISRNVPEYV